MEQPNVGFMMRNRLGRGCDGNQRLVRRGAFAGGARRRRLSVDFVMDLPFLHAGFYYFSPAVADGTLDQYEMCDWIDNACAIEVIQRTTTHGHLRIPVRVRVHSSEAQRHRGSGDIKT